MFVANRSIRRKRKRIRDAREEHRQAGGVLAFIAKKHSEEQGKRKRKKITKMNVDIKRKIDM